ncbi:hypothetical protein hamaS1_27460 [Moorella sp. Hama-1]|nr:hypothetical protein hamaS1_27460 [Moorella sp. Hama-1]
MVEMGDHCFTHIIPRLKSVIAGTDHTGVTKEYKWQGGGGFSFCELGDPLFDEKGWIRNNGVS